MLVQDGSDWCMMRFALCRQWRSSQEDAMRYQKFSHCYFVLVGVLLRGFTFSLPGVLLRAAGFDVYRLFSINLDLRTNISLFDARETIIFYCIRNRSLDFG